MLLSLLFVCCMQHAYAQQKISLNSDQLNWQLAPQDSTGRTAATGLPGYPTNGWVQAVVPGCVFTSYVQAGLEPDPNFGDNIYRTDKHRYNRNFWYRTSFDAPAPGKGHTWLNLEGINRKGDIYVNGTRVGQTDGFMQRGKFDITALLHTGEKNTLAILVQWPGLPIPNYASPTYISSDGWDWMPAVPGLLNGITDDVYLTQTGAVTLDDPWIRTTLASADTAAVSLQVNLLNHTGKAQQAVVSGTIMPGNIRFTQTVQLPANEPRLLHIDTTRNKQLLLLHPRLWWPNGYGDAALYTCALKLTIDGEETDHRSITFGVRQYSYDTSGGVLHIKVNGQRIFVKGGNWGMSEYLLRCRGSEYDLKVKLHRDMNLNLIRNWIGSTTDEELYDACDKYGIMVWDDFWLNSHPNLPNDVAAFNANAVEKIKRLRNHACIALWCGDNEGYPMAPLDGWLREDVRTFDGNDRLYHSNSHSDALTGSGPWTNFHPSWYFTKYPGGFGGDAGWGFRSEIGTAVFTNFESFKKFMPEQNWWPRNEMWNKHFFGASAANGGPDRYEAAINNSYGKPAGIEEFCRKAQLVNIETNKALFEGWQHHMWNDASGVVTWMSQSAYPSLVWQTYDYYYDLNGAYWGVKKACEPVHIQWSYADNTVKVANTTLQPLSNMKATAIVYNLDGSVAAKFGQSATLNIGADTIADCFTLRFSEGNMAIGKTAVASSVASEAGDALSVTDGSMGSRWSSAYSDSQWVYVDLGEVKPVGEVVVNWESAYAKSYALQVSTDAASWNTVYATDNGKGNTEQLKFKTVYARYVRLLGRKRATQWGYSLYEMEVYGPRKAKTELSDVHFIRLLLHDAQGRLVSDNFYWRSARTSDYLALNDMPKAKLSVSATLADTTNGKYLIRATIKNTSSAPALAIRVQLVHPGSKEQVLPVRMSDNYFTLMKGESRAITIEADRSLLKNGRYALLAEPFNR